MKVIVVGAGIIGVVSAYYLYKAGFDVIVVDRLTKVAGETSNMNGGQLSYSYVSPLGGADFINLAFKMLKGGTDQMKVYNWFDPNFIRFSIHLAKNNLPRLYLKNQKHLLDMTLRSKELMADFLEEHPLDFKYQENGKIHLHCDLKALKRAEKFAHKIEKFGLEQKRLSVEQCYALEPILKHRKGPLVGGIFSKQDYIGDCGQYARALASFLEKEGVVFKLGKAVKGLTLENEKFTGCLLDNNEYISGDLCVLASGASASKLLKQVGMSMPTYPVKGYSMTFKKPHVKLTHNITDHYRKCLYAPFDDQVRVSGFMHFDGLSKKIRKRTKQALLSLTQDAFPTQAFGNAEINVGFRPYTPSSTPIIGEASVSGVYTNIGQGMLGWTLAHASGDRLIKAIKNSI